VGVPLISETLWPLALMASMLLICTAKELTLAKGASVPTTKDGPLTPPDAAMLAVDPPQPAASNEAAARERRASKDLPRYRDDKVDIGHIAFCEVRSLSGTNAELAVGPLPMNVMMQASLGALVCGVIA
jgi:hypothetical protein